MRYDSTRQAVDTLIPILILLLAGFMLSGALAIAADSKPEVEAYPPVAREQATAPRPTAFVHSDRPVSPMLQEIRTVWQDKHAEIEALEGQFREASDHLAALDIQRRIEKMHLDLELQILRIQLDYARRAGRSDTVEKLEAAVEQMTAPRPVPQPQERPAPSRE